jgi:ACR3 family arsenite transporter
MPTCLLCCLLYYPNQQQVAHIIDDPLEIAIIAVPLVLQTFIMFALSIALAHLLRLPFSIAGTYTYSHTHTTYMIVHVHTHMHTHTHIHTAPAAFISSSNFFELGVGVAISAYGIDSPQTLVSVVGVLVEVPAMLALVKLSLCFKPSLTRRCIG